MSESDTALPAMTLPDTVVQGPGRLQVVWLTVTTTLMVTVTSSYVDRARHGYHVTAHRHSSRDEYM